MINKQELHKLFYYDQKTGKLFNKITRGRNKYGKKDNEAGCIERKGYRQVQINKKLYKTHRIIWVMSNDEISDKIQIDHINHDKLDNRLENLRLVDNQENHRNQNKRLNNTSGFTGVSWNKSLSKWEAYIFVNAKKICLGSFTDKKDAIKSRQQANIKYKFHKNHGSKIKEKRN